MGRELFFFIGCFKSAPGFIHNDYRCKKMYRFLHSVISNRFGISVASVATVFLLLSGCVGLGKRLTPPRIHISNIQGQTVKSLESVLQVDLRVFNTNEVSITIKGIDCELLINDRRFASGVSNKETTIPSYSTDIIPIVVYSSVLDIFRGLYGLHKEKTLTYQLKGKVSLFADDILPSVVPFKSEGELSLDGLPDST